MTAGSWRILSRSGRVLLLSVAVYPSVLRPAVILKRWRHRLTDHCLDGSAGKERFQLGEVFVIWPEVCNVSSRCVSHRDWTQEKLTMTQLTAAVGFVYICQLARRHTQVQALTYR